MKVLWIDGNLTFKAESAKELKLLHTIESAIRSARGETDEAIDLNGTEFVNMRDDAIQAVR